MVCKLFICRDTCVENTLRIMGPSVLICRYDHPFINMQMIRCEFIRREYMRAT